MVSNLHFGVEVCRIIESFAPFFGCHVALTGGSLYKQGDRKDLDLIFYRIRQSPMIDTDGLFNAMVNLGFAKPDGFGWIFKTEYKGVPIDMLFPEEVGGEEYPRAEEAKEQVAISIARPPQW